jgi:Undecaprenyl-phosphate galactose phosphotransferase WbaP
MPKPKKFLSFACLLLTDILALLSSFLLAHLLRSQVIPKFTSLFKYAPVPLEVQLKYGFLSGALIIIFVFSLERLYTKRFSFWDEVKHLYRGLVFSFVLLMLSVFLSRGYTQFSRVVIISAWILSLFLFPFFRHTAKILLVKLNLWKKKVLILGTDETARALAKGIRSNPTIGYEIMGFLSPDENEVGLSLLDDLKVIGKVSQVEKLDPRSGPLDIIISLPEIDQQTMIDLVETSEKVAETIKIVPRIGNIFTLGVDVETFGDVLSLSVARNLVKPWNIFIKRVIEIALTALLMIVFSPFLLIIAAAIRVDSRGPALFIQDRLGENGHRFRLIKFRSMFQDGDSKLQDYLEGNTEARREWQEFQKLRNHDPRVTRVGRFLRRYSLDELPQLINVLKGNMALVGPRPYLPREKDEIGKSYDLILRVKPGITGLWQVSGRNILPFKQRLLLDEYYIRNWSLWMDLVILIKSVKVFLSREGAF